MGVQPSDASVGLSSLSTLLTAVVRHWQVGLITDVFVGLFEAFSSPHAHPCMLAHPHAMPICIQAVPTWRSATSATVFETDSKLSRHFSSRVHWMLPWAPVDESGGYEPIKRILMCLCVSLAIFACTASPCMSMHMFCVPVWLLGLTWLWLPAPTGKSRIFDAFRHVLMISLTSAVIIVPLRMTSTFLCPLDTHWTDF